MRFSSKYQDEESDLLYYGYRYYNTRAGRWLSRDPIAEQGGLNLYGFVRSDAVNRADTLGLFSSSVHRPLTENAVRSAYSKLATTSKCQQRIFGAVLNGNEGQDAGNLLDNERHYNRDLSQQPAQAEAAYQNYLTQEKGIFSRELKKPSTSHCRRALWSIGRLSHSWQDFFAHAIRRDGLGGKENSGVPGWTAWSVGVTGTPDSTQNFYPSSYSPLGGGEHPALEEPVLSSSPEFTARYNAAQAYSTAQIAPLLQQWIALCRCPCEDSWGISWYTTEFPFR